MQEVLRDIFQGELLVNLPGALSLGFFFLPVIHIQTEQAQSAYLRQWEQSVSQGMRAYIICQSSLPAPGSYYS